jgi:hypothetical protein
MYIFINFKFKYMEKTVSNIIKIFPHLSKVIGQHNLPLFINSKVFFSSLVYCDKPNNNLKIILKTPLSPILKEDWLVYLSMRSFARTWLITGKLLRDEKDEDTFQNLQFYKSDSIERYFYLGLDEYLKHENMLKPTHELKTIFEYKRNVFIMSRLLNLKDLKSIKFFKEKFATKYVIKNSIIENELNSLKNPREIEYLNNYFSENKIKLLDVDFHDLDTFDKCVQYVQNNINSSSPILAELGPNTFTDVLEEKFGKNPIDFLIVTIYQGKINKECLGPDFPMLSKIERHGYRLIITSEQKTESGSLKFHTYALNKTNNINLI